MIDREHNGDPGRAPRSRGAPARTPEARGYVADRITLPALLVLAAVLRLVGLPDRGMWDADQGRDFLVLRSLLVDGVAPLVGPVTSVGDLHHGAAYYYLLAPLAALGGLDPTIVVLLFAAAGVAAVGLVWWLARSMGGPLAGLAAGLLVTVSPTAIAASVTIWNPNLVAPAAALCLASAWHAFHARQSRWWAPALAMAGLVVQLHIVALVLVVPLVGLLVADVRRAAGPDRRRLARAVAAGLAGVVVLTLPLIVHELTTGFGELRAAIEYFGGERDATTVGVAGRILVAAVRIAAWPITGLLVDAPAVAVAVTGLLVAFVLWRWRSSGEAERTGTRWLGATLGWSALALGAAVPDLAVVVRGLPNDQYHAFTDPVVPMLLGLGLAGLARLAGPSGVARLPRLAGLASASRGGEDPPSRAGPVLAAAALAALLLVELASLPPLRAPDGGWPAARAAAERVARVTGDRRLAVIGLPEFKPTDGFVFPLRFAGRPIVDDATSAGALVVVCDRLFEPAMGAACGGAAERTVERDQPGFPLLVDRFDLSERTSISVYLRR